MADWTTLEWGLSFSAAICLLIAAILGILLSISRARVERLQNEFHKMAASIGDILSADMSDSSTKLETLLVQTEAYLSSQGLSVSWHEVDPLEYPKLMPLFIRCALLEVELRLLDELNSDEYWHDMAQAYDDVMFRFNRDLQGSHLNALSQSRDLENSEEVIQAQRRRILDLEDMVRHLRAISSDMEYVHPSNTSETEDDFEKRLMNDIVSNKQNQVDTSGQSVVMLNNIIDNQKERIKSLESDIKTLKSNQTELSSGNPNAVEDFDELSSVFDVDNADIDELRLRISQLEMAVNGKDHELNQLTRQMEMLQDFENGSGNEGRDDLQVRKALVQAWVNAEESLSELEQKVLRKAKL